MLSPISLIHLELEGKLLGKVIVPVTLYYNPLNSQTSERHALQLPHIITIYLLSQCVADRKKTQPTERSSDSWPNGCVFSHLRHPWPPQQRNLDYPSFVIRIISQPGACLQITSFILRVRIRVRIKIPSSWFYGHRHCRNHEHFCHKCHWDDD